jgi:hypothetical protein
VPCFRSPLLLFRHFIGSLVLVALVAVSFVGVILLASHFLFPVDLFPGVGALVVGPVRLSILFLFLFCPITHVHVSVVVVLWALLGFSGILGAWAEFPSSFSGRIPSLCFSGTLLTADISPRCLFGFTSSCLLGRGTGVLRWPSDLGCIFDPLGGFSRVGVGARIATSKFFFLGIFENTPVNDEQHSSLYTLVPLSIFWTSWPFLIFRCVLCSNTFFLKTFFETSLILESPIFLTWDVAPSILFPLRSHLTPSKLESIGSLGTKTFSPPLSKGLGFCLGEGGIKSIES